jgi:hypothetical protein
MNYPLRRASFYPKYNIKYNPSEKTIYPKYLTPIEDMLGFKK